MLIIGHHGTAGHTQGNTFASLKTSVEAGVDILKVDIYMSRDGEAILITDDALEQTHKHQAPVRAFSRAQLEEFSDGKQPIALDAILDKYFGKVLIDIELKSRGGGKTVVELLRKRIGSKRSLWDNVIVSSFKPSELIAARKTSKQVNLALLHELNSFAYIRYHRSLNLTAVGFHRLHINKLALEIAKRAGIFTYAYTVNRPDTAKRLEKLGIDGIVTDRPDILIAKLAQT